MPLHTRPSSVLAPPRPRGWRRPSKVCASLRLILLKLVGRELEYRQDPPSDPRFHDLLRRINFPHGAEQTADGASFGFFERCDSSPPGSRTELLRRVTLRYFSPSPLPPLLIYDPVFRKIPARHLAALPAVRFLFEGDYLTKKVIDTPSEET